MEIYIDGQKEFRTNLERRIRQAKDCGDFFNLLKIQK
jgi:hypothetical protein